MSHVSRIARWGTAALCAALVFVLACEGNNLFTPDAGGGGGALEVDTLIAPGSIEAGDVLDLRVKASGSQPITQVNIRLRNAFADEVVIPIDPPSTSVTEDVSIEVPTTVEDTLLIIKATATNQSGDVSEVVSDTVRVGDGTSPSVSVIVQPTAAGTDSTVAITVEAQDNVGLNFIGYALRTSGGDILSSDTAHVAGGAERDSASFDFVVPDTLHPTTLEAIGFARDLEGLADTSAVATLEVLDLTPPEVIVQRPDSGASFPVGDSLLVAAELSDLTGIKQVTYEGIAIRTDPTQDTKIVQRYETVTTSFPQLSGTLLPSDTTLLRYLQPTDDDTSEPVLIIATAIDSVGNVATDTARIIVGGPQVEIRSPRDGDQFSAGDELPIRIFAADPAGLDSAQVVLTGVVDTTLAFPNLLGRDTLLADTTIALPASASGEVTLTASAVNTNGIGGESLLSPTIEVISGVIRDTLPPSLSRSIAVGSRLELDDEIRVTVTADDNGGAGLGRIGITALALYPNTAVFDTVFRDVSFAPQTSTERRVFSFRLSDFGLSTDTLTLPARIALEVHAFAVDTAGNRACTVHATEESLECEATTHIAGTDTFYITVDQTGQRPIVDAVAGRTVSLPAGDIMADVVVDTPREKLYLSNFSSNLVNVIELDGGRPSRGRDDLRPDGSVRVGSRPWGLFIDNSGDTLIVANSGGTNISFVDLASLEEARRLQTPNAVLFEVEVTTDGTTGQKKYSKIYLDYSDRPQFVVQDFTGQLLYSTEPTGSAPEGTIRRVEFEPGWVRPEAEFLFYPFVSTPDVVGIARVDSMAIEHSTASGAPTDTITIWDHEPGFPNQILVGRGTLNDAISELEAAGSDILSVGGKWDREAIGLSDTTYVAASGDRQTIAFGEGATAPTGRIILYDASTGAVSGQIQVEDLINNADERVLGVALNQDGSLGVARGQEALYAFNDNLRLLGLFGSGVQVNAGGAALHPEHATATASTANTLAFVGTENHTIRIVDTYHFSLRGEIPIRDNIVGVLRSSPPLPGDNAGLTCPGDPACVVLKLYGITDSGGVVVVNVRARQIED